MGSVDVVDVDGDVEAEEELDPVEDEPAVVGGDVVAPLGEHLLQGRTIVVLDHDGLGSLRRSDPGRVQNH